MDLSVMPSRRIFFSSAAPRGCAPTAAARARVPAPALRVRVPSMSKRRARISGRDNRKQGRIRKTNKERRTRKTSHKRRNKKNESPFGQPLSLFHFRPPGAPPLSARRPKMEKRQLMAFQKLDIYRIAMEFARRVHEAYIRDPELRDQVTRAAKSAFLHLCEGLPNPSPGMRRKYFSGANDSLHEAVGGIDLALSIGALSFQRAVRLQ